MMAACIYRDEEEGENKRKGKEESKTGVLVSYAISSAGVLQMLGDA